MIVRRYLKIGSVLQYTWKSNLFFLSVALLAAFLFEQLGWKHASISMQAIGPLGTALAVFLAFRNSSAYDRWWEARKLWGKLVNDSRNFSRQILTFVCGDDVKGFHREAVYRHVAYVNALRLHLRGQTDCLGEILEPFLKPDELKDVLEHENVPAAIALKQGARLRDAHHAGTLDDFRHMQLDETMSRFLDIQGGCERIKKTPLPRQYDYFPQVFLYVYSFFLPFGLVADFGWLTFIISLPISFVFLTLQAAGRVNEDPFENRWTDTPMSTLSRMIEINLRQSLGEREMPPAIELDDGVAY